MKNLIKLYGIDSPSGQTKKMKGVIIAALKSIEGVTFKTNKGNIYAVKGKSESYPCIVSHIDEVHKPNPFKQIKVAGDMIFGYDSKKKDFCGIGADDKNGIWICLEAMKRLDYCKVAFFRDEEIGCKGSEKADMDFFEDCRFVLQCDRKGSSDFITDAGCVELCDKSFFDSCNAERFGYKINHGFMTDVMQLKENALSVACANLSCGYYNPHTNEEFTIFSELENTLNLVIDICENVEVVVNHGFKKERFTDKYYDWYYDDYYSDSKQGWHEVDFTDQIIEFLDFFEIKTIKEFDLYGVNHIYEDFLRCYIVGNDELSVDDFEKVARAYLQS